MIRLITRSADERLLASLLSGDLWSEGSSVHVEMTNQRRKRSVDDDLSAPMPREGNCAFEHTADLAKRYRYLHRRNIKASFRIH
jgi:hypothetical protein